MRMHVRRFLTSSCKSQNPAFKKWRRWGWPICLGSLICFTLTGHPTPRQCIVRFVSLHIPAISSTRTSSINLLSKASCGRQRISVFTRTAGFASLHCAISTLFPLASVPAFNSHHPKVFSDTLNSSRAYHLYSQKTLSKGA